jgi:hypothetical protein
MPATLRQSPQMASANGQKLNLRMHLEKHARLTKVPQAVDMALSAADIPSSFSAVSSPTFLMAHTSASRRWLRRLLLP